MRLFSLCLMILTVVYGCDLNRPDQGLLVKPLHPYYSYIPEGTTKIKIVYFWVDEFKYDSAQVNTLVDFAKNKFLDSSVSQEYAIHFYKKSNEINDNFESKEGDLIDWHKKDLILKVSIRDAGIKQIYKYKDGILLNTSSDAEIISIKPTHKN